MIGNAILATLVILMALVIWLLGACQFLIPYRSILWNTYGTIILSFVGVLALNIFAAVYLLCRKVFLKDTGRKLAHVDRQVRSGESIADELAEYLD